MIERNVQQIKNSYLVTIPAQLCGLMGIKKGTVMGIELENNKIVMSPVSASLQAKTDTGDATHPQGTCNHE